MINKGRKTEQEIPVNTGPRVCELLRTTRERSGQELQTVADVLRIRYVYLEAIEDGRYEDLPGKTYVVGFVRAYSEFLGLDAEEVVKRFKEEIDGFQGRAELMFPSPVTEQSIPGGAIILIGLVILGAAYGGWYFLSSQNRSMAELVPDLPAKFSEIMENVKGAKKEEESADSEEGTESSSESADTSSENDSEQTPVSEADTQQMAQDALKAVEEAARKEDAQEAAEEIQPVETVKLEETTNTNETQAVAETVEETVEEVVKEVVEEVNEAAETVTEAVSETVSAVAPETETATEETAVEETVQTSEEPQEEPAPTPAVMTEKILLKAVDYAWIQVTDASGNVVHTQVLNEKEQYEVPQTAGLILRTGNAGGLEIYVDDQKVPSVGEVGEVRRKIMLDPQKLIDGKAVEN